MSETILIGQGREMTKIPREEWEQGLSVIAPIVEPELEFMSEEHHRVRNFVVKELPHAGQPLSPELIARELDLTIDRILAILDELEKHLMFLFRNKQGAVAWAYPVTVDSTPHHLTFSTGEQLHAAWAIDAVATPFVQGCLRGEALAVVIRSECAHTHQPLTFEMDSEFRYRIVEGGANPLVFNPFVDFSKLREPSIIDAFWRKSVFFQSEEHARAYRAKTDQIGGNYFTLEQCAYFDRIVQSAIFAFKS